jgi:hypothetical protein
MAKRKNHLLEALKERRSYTWTEPDGGDLASMRAAIKHGQTLTMSPVADPHEVQMGDIVLVKWHEGYIIHLIQEIQGDQFLIVNSIGKINGWVKGGDILGRVTYRDEPEPPPDVPTMLDQLDAAYQTLATRLHSTNNESNCLCSTVDDLHWYADRIGSERWSILPRSNKWSFDQHVWHLTKEAKRAARADSLRSLDFYINHGKEHVGWIAELFALLEYSEIEHSEV